MAERQRDSQKLRNAANRKQEKTDVSEASPLLQNNDTTSVDSSAVDTNADESFFSHCKVSCSRRTFPKGKGLLLVFAIYFMESFAFYSAIKGIRELLFETETKKTNFVFSFLEDSLGRLFYPFAGILADSFLGRFRVIHIGLWLIWCGVAVLCISLPIVGSVPDVVARIILPILSIILISVGSGSVEVNTVSFGVDQLPQGSTSEHISSFFFWYYFVRNAGILSANVAFIVLFGVRFSFFPEDLTHPHRDLAPMDYRLKTLIVIVLATVMISLTLFLHICWQHWYFKNARRDNPVKAIINITYFSATVKRHLPVYRRTFRYGEAKKPRIELAKIEYDGIFQAEEVENVKTFCQILLLIFSLGGYFASYGAAYSKLSAQLGDKGTIELDKSLHFLPPYLSQFVNGVTIVIFLPILNHAIIPFLPGISLKLRLGAGVILNLFSLVTAAFIQGTVEKDDHEIGEEKLLWLLLPAIFLALGEALVFVSGLEFIYAQAPEPMKGLLTGLFYFAFGVFVGGSDIFFYFFPSKTEQGISVTFWFYIIFLVVALLGLVAYTIVACVYRNRQRPADDEDDLVNRGYAQDIFG